jgi:CRP-like cAMP-binding protein/class 3 adenylate cyclase
MKKKDNPEREVAILLTDMKQYAKLTAQMTTRQIRDYIIDYQNFLQTSVMKGEEGAQAFEPFAGDSSITTFENRPGEDSKKKCKRALKVAIDIAKAVENQQIPFTRIGIFVGKIIEAQFEKHTLRFGNSFAAANRLEELCAYFGTTILMDRDIAWAQDEEREYVVSIGKITPKNFKHPIHVYSIYKPGIHQCPVDMNKKHLMEFIRLKNEGIEHFIGNAQRGISPYFPLADEMLHQAASLFQETTGVIDIATLRILEYLREYPYPMDTFEQQGMTIDEKQHHSMGIQLSSLSQRLFKALDKELYHALVVETDWDTHFKVEWRRKGEKVILIGDEPNGIYYLAKGEVRVENGRGKTIAQLSAGDFFGEMAYFSKDAKRNATVVAITDIVVRKISTEDFEKSPILQKVFAELATRRTRTV